MVEAPLVSVVIPAYNRAHTILRALDAVLIQTFRDFELIVVDDGSGDHTAEIVRQRADPRVRVISHDVNRGAAAARNTGVRNASGKYAAFCDSDDEWLPEKLAEQLALLSGAKAALKACTTGFYLVMGETIREAYPEPILPLQKKLLWTCDRGPGTTLLVERAVFDEIGLMDEGMPRYEDWDWLIRYAGKYDLATVQKPLARVFRDSKPAPEKVEAATLILLEKYRKNFAAFGWRYERETLARRYLEVAQNYYEGGRNLPKERAYYLKALLSNPFQPAGVYLEAVDALLGSRLRPAASRLKSRVLGRARRGKG